MVEQWNNDGGRMEHWLLYSGAVMVEQWNRNDGRLEQRWWNSEQWNRDGGIVEQLNRDG